MCEVMLVLLNFHEFCLMFPVTVTTIWVKVLLFDIPPKLLGHYFSLKRQQKK